LKKQKRHLVRKCLFSSFSVDISRILIGLLASTFLACSSGHSKPLFKPPLPVVKWRQGP